MADKFAFSIRASCSVMDSYGLGENAMIAILQELKSEGKITVEGYVMQAELNKKIQEKRLAA